MRSTVFDMTGGALGGGLIFVVAALLWAAVLVPAWVRRREFRAAERNAMRLQRTLRVLAETSEVPEEVRLEATAKEALAKEKLLRTAQKRQEAERAAELAEARAAQVRAEIRAQQKEREQRATRRAARLRRPLVRRVRAVAALAGVLGLGGLLVGAGMALAGLGGAVLLWAALSLSLGLATLVLLAPGRVKTPEIPQEQVLTGSAPDAPLLEAAHADAETADVSAVAHAEAQRAAAARIAKAQAMARARAEKPAERVNQLDSMLLDEARTRRAERTEARRPADIGATAPTSNEGASARSAVAAPAPTSSPAPGTRAPRAAELRAERLAAAARLRQMGVVGDTSEGMPDLDAVFRRRRNAS